MKSVTKFSSNAGANKIFATLQSEGAVVIDGLVPNEQMSAMHDELAGCLAASRPGPDNFRGWKTCRIGALCARSSVFRELAVHPLVLDVANRILLSHCARIQLMYTQLIEISPGESAQPLHRDDEVWPWPREPGQEWAVIGMWAVSDFTADNGATRVVSGSHRWERTRNASDGEIAIAEMEKGSLLLHLGSVLHGGGANESNRVRLGATLDYALGWLRQVENQYLIAAPDLARTFSPELQDLLGYAVHGRIVGECDLADPRVSLLGRDEADVQRADREAGASADDSTLSGYGKQPL